jgi:ATP synthase protein I
MSDNAAGNAEDNTDAADLGLTTDLPRTHAESVLKLADAMLRAALWPGVATVVVGIVVSAVFAGVEGALGALVGGVVAFASSLATLWLMRRTATMSPFATMAAALGGFAGKMLLLLIVMLFLGSVSWLHKESLAYTMLGTILVWVIFETIAFRRTKIPTLIINPAEPSK